MTTEERVDKLFRVVLEGNGEESLIVRMTKVEQVWPMMNGKLDRMLTDMQTLKTDKTDREAVTAERVAVAADLKEKNAARDRSYKLLIAVVTVLCILVTTAITLLTWHYTHHADILSSHPVTEARYNSDVAPH